MKNDLTIILLLKERQKFTPRFIEYYLKNNLGYNLFISDGSKKKLDTKILAKIKKNPLITYKKFKEDTSYKRYYKKKILTLQILNTKYVLFASNDDFLVYKTIQKCLRNLKKNNQLNGAGGTIYGFSIKRDINKRFFLNNIHKLYLKRNFEHKNPSERVNNYFQDPISTIHFIVNRKKLLKTYKTTIKHFENNADLKDELTDIINLINGKIKIINSPILFHQSTEQSESSRRPNLYLNHLKNKKFSKDLIKFINIISKRTKLDTSNILQNYYNKMMLPLLKDLTFKKEASVKEIIKTLSKKFKRRLFLNKNKIKNLEKYKQSNEVKKIAKTINKFLNEIN